MGGVDKALVMLDGQSLIARVVARFEPQVAALAVSGRRGYLGLPCLPDAAGTGPPSDAPSDVPSDAPLDEPARGLAQVPGGGMAGGMAGGRAGGRGVALRGPLVGSPSGVPSGVPSGQSVGPLAGVLAGLRWAAAAGADCVVTVPVDGPFVPGDLVPRLWLAGGGGVTLAQSAGRAHPTFALWPVGIAGALEAFLASGVKARVLDFARSAGVVMAEFPDDGSFVNLNSPEDLARAAAGPGMGAWTGAGLVTGAGARAGAAAGADAGAGAVTGVEAEAGSAAMRVFGIIGWKNAGKTGLMERLVAHVAGLGFRVSTIKHVHHDVDLDQPGKDSFRHRAAGASEVVLAGARRFAILREHRGAEPDLQAVIARMALVDLVLVEGYKSDSHPRIEVFRAEAGHALIQPGDPHVRAVASDVAGLRCGVPVLDLNDTAAVAAFILREVGLMPGPGGRIGVRRDGAGGRGA